MKWKLSEEKIHLGAAKPRISTIPKTKLVTRHSHSHISDAVVIPLTLTRSPSWMLSNQVSYLKGSLMESFTLGPTPKIDFTRNKEHTSANTLSKHYGILYWIFTNYKPRAIYLYASENLILNKFGLWLWSIQTITREHPDSLLWLPFQNRAILPKRGPCPDGLTERPDDLHCHSFSRL
jgi:hypothetical protein